MEVKYTSRTAAPGRKRKNAQPQQPMKTKRTKVNSTTSSTCANSKLWNFGRPTYNCKHCKALLWCEERLNSNRGTREASFGICCKQGKISLPPQEVPPPYLESLLTSEGQDSVNFKKHIRAYNSMFSFTSMGGNVDKEINTRRGPYIFRLHGENYHHIGTLLPEGDNKPRFSQLYIYDTKNEVSNRINASRSNAEKPTVDLHIVEELQKMLDETNIIAKTFRMARDRFKEGDYHDYTLRILDK